MQNQDVHALLTVFCARERISTLTPENLEKCVRWIVRRRSAESMVIASPICPDYSYEKTADGGVRYTFDNLGADIGVAGERLLRLAPPLRELLCAQLPIKEYRHHALAGDFEGYSADILRRLGSSGEEFAARVLQSVDRYQRTAADRVSACTLSSLCSGRDGWTHALKAMKKRAAPGNFAKLGDRELIRAIGIEQRPRYERLFGSEVVTASLCEILTAYRAIELATVGKIISDTFHDPLILSVGDGQLAQFFALAVEVPVLDLELAAQS